MIRKITLDDASKIADIYNYYIAHTVITFEEELVATEEMKSRIQKKTKTHPWLVYEENGIVVGYAYADLWAERYSYRFSSEVSVYLQYDLKGEGIGSKLYASLIDLLKEMNCHSLIGGLTLPNVQSQALHEKFGFKKVAHYKEVGYKFDKWLDVGYWQLILNK